MNSNDEKHHYGFDIRRALIEQYFALARENIKERMWYAGIYSAVIGYVIASLSKSNSDNYVVLIMLGVVILSIFGLLFTLRLNVNYNSNKRIAKMLSPPDLQDELNLISLEKHPAFKITAISYLFILIYLVGGFGTILCCLIIYFEINVVISTFITIISAYLSAVLLWRYNGRIVDVAKKYTREGRKPMADHTEKDELQEYVARALRDATRWTRAWSALYHSFIFGAAVLSAAAALTLQLKTLNLSEPGRADLATVFAALASLIGVISVSGGFARKWRANRMTKAALEEIEIDIMDPSYGLGKIRARLAEMKRIHHLSIVGDEELDKRQKGTAS